MRSIADRYAGTAVFFASFAVYLFTVAPEITFWDSGELIFGAVSLGLPHPPAYPVFCMLGKLISLLPMGNAAYRVNILSALFGSLTTYIAYRLAHGLCAEGPARTPAAAATALLFAFSSPFWSQSVVTEVYTINSFLLAVLAYFLLRYEREGRVADLHASAFALGLAGAAHQSIVFLFPAYAAYYIYTGKLRSNPSRPVVSAFFTLLGYSAVLYTPVRASAGPAINIGRPVNMYWFKWVLRLSDHIGTLKSVPHQLVVLTGGEAAPWLAAALVVCVVAAWLLRKRPYILFLLFASASYYAGMRLLTAGNEDIIKWGLQVKFYIPVLLFGAPVAALIMAGFLGAFRPSAGAAPSRTTAIAIAAWLLLALPAWAVHKNYKANDNSANFFAFDFASNTLKSVEQRGALFAWGDNGVFPVWYLQGFERYRDDILFIHTELLTYNWYMAKIQNRIYTEYGFKFRPPSRITNLKLNVPILKFELEKVTPVYFDYSAVAMLDIGLDKLQPQGLVHLVKSCKPERLGSIWGRYVLRGALDQTTNKAFAAEGILDIYGYEAGLWAQQAYKDGDLPETLMAYGLAKQLGYGDAYLDQWAEGIRRKLNKASK